MPIDIYIIYLYNVIKINKQGENEMTTTYQTIKEIASEIRNELKKEFPEYKFSVTKDVHTITVSLMEAPESPFSKMTQWGSYDGKDYEFDGEYAQLNHYHLAERCNGYYLTKSAVKLLEKVVKISNKKNWDRSDLMTDYFDVNYYFNLQIGKWNKPFKVNPAN